MSSSTEFPQHPTSPAGPAPVDREPRSIGELLGDVTTDLSTLMRKEVELAKTEARESMARAGKGLGLLAAAVIAALLFLIFITLAAWWALGTLVGHGWSAVIVAAVWAVVGVILASAGKTEMKKITGLPQTADTVGKIPHALTGHEENR